MIVVRLDTFPGFGGAELSIRSIPGAVDLHAAAGERGDAIVRLSPTEARELGAALLASSRSAESLAGVAR